MKSEWPRQLMALMGECQALRLAQVYRWAALRHGVDAPGVGAVLLRLRTRGVLAVDGEFASLPYRKPDPTRMAAFDLLLQLAGPTAENISAAPPPVLLRFTAGEGDGLRFFTLVHGRPGEEAHLAALVEGDSSPDHRWIILVDSAAQRPLLCPAPNCYFALPEGTGPEGQVMFRFFK